MYGGGCTSEGRRRAEVKGYIDENRGTGVFLSMAWNCMSVCGGGAVKSLKWSGRERGGRVRG